MTESVPTNEDGNERNVSVEQVVKVDNNTSLEIVIDERGLQASTIQRAVDYGLLPSSGEKYDEVAGIVRKRVHLLDVSPFAYLTWFGEQPGYIKYRDKIRDIALAAAFFRQHVSGNYVFQEKITGEGHVFVHYNFIHNSKPLDGLLRGGEQITRGRQREMVVETFIEHNKGTYLHELEHIIQFLFCPEEMKRNIRTKTKLRVGEAFARGAILGTVILIDSSTVGPEVKVLANLLGMGVAVANSTLEHYPVGYLLGSLAIPIERRAYKVGLNSSTDDIAGLTIRRVDTS